MLYRRKINLHVLQLICSSIGFSLCDNKEELFQQTYVCDIVPHCTDGSDETNCGKSMLHLPFLAIGEWCGCM